MSRIWERIGFDDDFLENKENLIMLTYPNTNIAKAEVILPDKAVSKNQSDPISWV